MAFLTRDIVFPAATPADQRRENAAALAAGRAPRILAQRSDMQPQMPNLPPIGQPAATPMPLIDPQALGPYIPAAPDSRVGQIYEPLQIIGPPMSTGAAIAVGAGAFALGLGAMWLIFR